MDLPQLSYPYCEVQMDYSLAQKYRVLCQPNEFDADVALKADQKSVDEFLMKTEKLNDICT